MKKWNIVVTVLLFILAILCYLFFDVYRMKILEDELANDLLCSFLSHVGLSLMFIWMLYRYSGYSLMRFTKQFPKYLLWCLPCFMVAFINFPYSALISGEAGIDRKDLLGLYILYIISVAVLEEFIFRGSLYILVNDLLRGKKHKPFFTVLICASVFSLFHLTNLLMGADIMSTLLQCVYTFLIGAMLMVAIMKTKNIWLCILIHAIFDFGGLLIIHIGFGNPWDTLFWILTIVGGLLCAGHIIYTLIKLEKDYVS